MSTITSIIRRFFLSLSFLFLFMAFSIILENYRYYPEIYLNAATPDFYKYDLLRKFLNIYGWPLRDFIVSLSFLSMAISLFALKVKYLKYNIYLCLFISGYTFSTFFYYFIYKSNYYLNTADVNNLILFLIFTFCCIWLSNKKIQRLFK